LDESPAAIAARRASKFVYASTYDRHCTRNASGGHVGDYQIGRERTLSAVVLDAFGTSVAQFVQVVGDARTDDDIAERLWRAATVPGEMLSARLRRFTVSDVPAELRPEFQRRYGTEHPAGRLVFDVLDADDARTFPRKA
jgi:hypothetical protein